MDINKVLRTTQRQIQDFIETPEVTQETLNEVAENLDLIRHFNQAVDTSQVSTVKGILDGIQFIQNNKTAQEKVGALQATLFWDALQGAHDSLQNVGDDSSLKRGLKVEGIDEGPRGA